MTVSPDASDNGAEIRRPAEKYFIAMLAGLTPVATKYLARDSDKDIMELLGPYAATSLCLIILGFIVCYLSNETNRMKLFMLALSAPALVSNLSGDTDVSQNQASSVQRAGFEEIFASKAHAADKNGRTQVIQAGFINNIQRYFGKSNAPDGAGYWVIVYSTKDVNEAAAVVDQINRIDGSFKPFVGNRRPGNKFYPVIIGDKMDQAQAQQLLNKATRLKSRMPQFNISPYLDNYPDR